MKHFRGRAGNRRNATSSPAQPERTADAIGLALGSFALPHMHHGFSAKYVDACPASLWKRLATPQMTAAL
jgi:hypothetical protein